jgi:hypothetical protein
LPFFVHFPPFFSDETKKERERIRALKENDEDASVPLFFTMKSGVFTMKSGIFDGENGIFDGKMVVLWPFYYKKWLF